jgi:hypothetical protein
LKNLNLLGNGEDQGMASAENFLIPKATDKLSNNAKFPTQKQVL